MLSSNSMTISEMNLQIKDKDAIPDYRDIEFSEIMEYYKPTWLAWAGFTASVFASLSLPLFGFVLSKYIFVLSMYGDAGVSREEFSHDRNVWTAGFVALCIGIGSSTYL